MVNRVNIMSLGDIQLRTSHPKAKLVLGAPRRNAKPQLGKVICGGIVRDFRGQFISVLVDSLLEITLFSVFNIYVVTC